MSEMIKLVKKMSVTLCLVDHICCHFVISIESSIIGKLDARSMILRNWALLERGMNKRSNDTSFNSNHKLTAEIQSTKHKVHNFFLMRLFVCNLSMCTNGCSDTLTSTKENSLDQGVGGGYEF